LAKRRIVEARLSTVQAHADPDFIFDILTRIEALYGHDAERAELLLSQLIDFLREALPRVRDGRTTLGREARLVGAWLAIARVRLDDRLEYAIDIPQSLAGLPFHAMLLLPLVTGVLRSAAGRGGRIAVGAEALGDRIRISVTEDDRDSGGFPADGFDEFDELRTRLVDLYGEKAQLSIGTATMSRRTIALEIPAEMNEPATATGA
ncbi:MAG: histidine kinase, partial [Casimicrobiaceae bacterium]